MEALGAVSILINFISDSTRIGAVHVKNTKTLDTISTVGDLLRTLIGVATLSDSLESELAELSSQLKALDRRLGQEMTELASFIMEHNFGVNLVVRVNTMNQYMQALLENPTNHNRGLYQKEVLEFPPLRHARDISSWLMQDSTNPIKYKMKADPLRSTETFEKWEKTIMTLLNQLLIQETFLNGLLWDSNMFGPKELEKVIRNVERQIDELRNGYKNSYWPSIVENLIHQTQDNHRSYANERKCAIIRDGLRKMMTDDEFYVMVYDDCDWSSHHSFQGYNYVHIFRRNECNVVVCRSRRWNIETVETHEKFRNQLCGIDFQVLTGNKKDIKDIPEKYMNRIDRCGFVGIISERRNPVVYSASRFNHRDNRPGGVRTVFHLIDFPWTFVPLRFDYSIIVCFE